jgi:hypothetical protein
VAEIWSANRSGIAAGAGYDADWPAGRSSECVRNKGVTEIVKMPGRGHALTIDAGWREVAEKALEFVKRFTKTTARAA